MNSSAAARLCRAHLLAIGPDADAASLADVVWLALQLTWQGAAEPDGRAQLDDRTLSPADLEFPSNREPGGELTAPTSDGVDRAPDGSVPLYPAYSRHPFGTIGASWINIPAGEPLPQRLHLERALKPFKRRLPSRQQRELDPIATAEASAEWRSITPVYRASPERWFEVEILAEDSDAMRVWDATLLELQRMLARHGAFRRARLWRYTLRNEALVLSTAAAVAAPRVLVDPQGRRLCWFLTTGTSALWRHPALSDFAATLGRYGPTAIVQLMPHHAWPHTLLGDASDEALSGAPGMPTARLWLREPFSGELERAPDALTVPITSLEPRRLATWARFAMASSQVLHPAVRLQATPAAGLGPAAPRVREGSPRKRIAAFRAMASPAAFQLLRLLSAMPLSLPVMRLMQMGMPERAQVHLAEILLSGLIERVTPPGAEVPPELVEYDFLPGIREELADSLTVSEGNRIEASVTQIAEQARRFVEAYAGSANTSFPALVPDAMGEEKVLALARHFLHVNQEFRSLPLSPNPPEPRPASPKPGFEFLSEGGIKKYVLSQNSLAPSTSELRALLIYKTLKQQSWLLASDQQAILVVDAANTRGDARLVQRSGSWFDMLPIRAEAKPGTAPIVYFGGAGAPGWDYSAELFPSPSALEEALVAMVPGGADGAIVRLRKLALEYDEIRAHLRPSPRRTNAMQDVVNRMANLPPLSGLDLGLAASNAAPGIQLIAIVSLQRNFDPSQLDWLFERITGDQAFLAYQAALSLQRASPGLSKQDRLRMQRLAIEAKGKLLAAGLADGNVHSLLDEFVASPRPQRARIAGGVYRRVLINTTGWTLASYRTHAVALLEEFGHEVVDEAPIESVDQLKARLARFATCDLVLLLVGTSGEYVQAKRADPNPVLLIELEYREAVRVRKPVLVMMREEDDSESMDEGASGQMRRFRQMLLIEHKVQLFRSINQFDGLLRRALRDDVLVSDQGVEQVLQRRDTTPPSKTGGLSSPRQVEEVADLLSAFADQMHERVMRLVRADNDRLMPESDLEVARILLDVEMELRQRANHLYTDAAACVVSKLDRSQQDVRTLMGSAVSAIAKMPDVRGMVLLARRLLGLGAALATGLPAPILDAIEAVEQTLTGRWQDHTPSQPV